MKKLPFYAFMFVLGVALAQAAFYLPAMPDPMASHFGHNGEADGYLSRTGFFIFIGILFALLIFVFVVMPKIFPKFNIRKGINLPNKEYWMSPERIDEFYDNFSSSFIWFGVITAIFLVGVLQLVFEANFQPKPILNVTLFLAMLISYLVLTLIWTVAFYRKFSRIS